MYRWQKHLASFTSVHLLYRVEEGWVLIKKGHARAVTYCAPLPGEPATATFHTVAGDDAHVEVVFVGRDASAAVAPVFTDRLLDDVTKTFVGDLLVEDALDITGLDAFSTSHSALQKRGKWSRRGHVLAKC